MPSTDFLPQSKYMHLEDRCMLSVNEWKRFVYVGPMINWQLPPPQKKKNIFLPFNLHFHWTQLEVELAHKDCGHQGSLYSRLIHCLCVLCRQQWSSVIHSFIQVLFTVCSTTTCANIQSSCSSPRPFITKRCCRVLKIQNLCLGPCNQREQFKGWFGHSNFNIWNICVSPCWLTSFSAAVSGFPASFSHQWDKSSISAAQQQSAPQAPARPKSSGLNWRPPAVNRLQCHIRQIWKKRQKKLRWLCGDPGWSHGRCWWLFRPET